MQSFLYKTSLGIFLLLAFQPECSSVPSSEVIEDFAASVIADIHDDKK
jgi:hypothetical protein